MDLRHTGSFENLAIACSSRSIPLNRLVFRICFTARIATGFEQSLCFSSQTVPKPPLPIFPSRIHVPRISDEVSICVVLCRPSKPLLQIAFRRRSLVRFSMAHNFEGSLERENRRENKAIGYRIKREAKTSRLWREKLAEGRRGANW